MQFDSEVTVMLYFRDREWSHGQPGELPFVSISHDWCYLPPLRQASRIRVRALYTGKQISETELEVTWLTPEGVEVVHFSLRLSHELCKQAIALDRSFFESSVQPRLLGHLSEDRVIYESVATIDRTACEPWLCREIEKVVRWQDFLNELPSLKQCSTHLHHGRYCILLSSPQHLYLRTSEEEWERYGPLFDLHPLADPPIVADDHAYWVFPAVPGLLLIYHFDRHCFGFERYYRLYSRAEAYRQAKRAAERRNSEQSLAAYEKFRHQETAEAEAALREL